MLYSLLVMSQEAGDAEVSDEAMEWGRRAFDGTDRVALKTLHQALVQLAPTLGARVALSVAISDVDGAEAGLRTLEQIEGADDFQPAWATRAYLLAQAGQVERARSAYARAIVLTTDAGTRTQLQHSLDDLNRIGDLGGQRSP